MTLSKIVSDNNNSVENKSLFRLVFYNSNLTVVCLRVEAAKNFWQIHFVSWSWLEIGGPCPRYWRLSDQWSRLHQKLEMKINVFHLFEVNISSPELELFAPLVSARVASRA